MTNKIPTRISYEKIIGLIKMHRSPLKCEMPLRLL